LDGTRNDGKLSRSVRSRGKAGDYIKRLPIANLMQKVTENRLMALKTERNYLRDLMEKKGSMVSNPASLFSTSCTLIGVQITPVETSLTPIEVRITPIEERLTPIEVRLTPIEERFTPIEVCFTPIEERFTPIGLSQTLVRTPHVKHQTSMFINLVQ
ncbi:hypothetical protein, partial [Neobacillus niacini]|uniref:hypothetical protein n=1 Tax=Neobacillus niacini TaxID=86668 RepID=UPI002860E25B